MIINKYFPTSELQKLTHPQMRIWYIEKIYPGTAIYNISSTTRIKGPVDFNILESAIQKFIKANDGIRLHIVEDNGIPKQFVKPYEKVKIHYKDFSSYDNPERELHLWVQEKVQEPFAIENEDLYYFMMFKLSENENGIFTKIHHLISDGWTFNIMSHTICSNYTRLVQNEGVEDLNECSYIEYLEKESKYLSSDRFEQDKIFWKEKFATLPENLIEDGSNSLSGQRSTFDLDRDISLRIKSFVNENKCSINTFFVSLLLLYLNISYQKEDIIIGTPVLNRAGKRERNTFGMFTSTMPFRMTIDRKSTFLELIKQVNSELKSCYHHQHYPYDLLASDLETKKKGYDSLFQICVNFYNTNIVSELNDLKVNNKENYSGYQLFPLQIVIKDWTENEGLQLDFDFKTDIYTQQQIVDMFNHFKNLMLQVLNSPNDILNNYTYISELEKNLIIYEFNSRTSDYPKNKAIYQLIEEQVERTPNNIAVCFEDVALTYSELNAKANQLAWYLKQNGVTRETIVGLLVTHSLEMVIGILGILKAGGAYLPIDPEYPIDRQEYLANDSAISIILTNCIEKIKISFSGKILTFQDDRVLNGQTQNLALKSNPRDLAYIIYTSGSTGNPKGVMIENQGLVNYICWAKKMYIKRDTDAFALYSSLSFDLTVTSIFTPLIGGNKIIVYKDDEDEYVLYKILRENKANIIKLTPSHLSLIKGMDCSKLIVNRFIVGGEDLKVNLASSIHESFKGNIEIYNEYGPTETVVGCMIYKYDYENDKELSVPIGVPADNVQIYILDDNLKPLPKGCCGEMYISGDGVARGYLNREELNCTKFIDNPYIKGNRLYKTGDYACFTDNGILKYIGRVDSQVKIRGHRIELGEIEKCLQDLEFIKDAVVIDREDKNGNKYLCAYITALKEISEIEVRKHLAKLLPEYMIPLHIICLESLPLTANGKINRGLLPEPKQIPKDSKYIAPRNDYEQKLMDVMQEILAVDKIGMKDDFYGLGGDSIKAIQAASKLNQIGLKIKVKDILENSLFEEMALRLNASQVKDEIDQGMCDGYVEQTPIFTWFFSRRLKNINYYNQSVMLIFKQDIDKSIIQWAFNELIRHHDALRLVYDEEIGKMFFDPISKTKLFEIPEFDLSKHTNEEQERNMAQICDEIKSSINITNGILIKACTINLGCNGKRLFLTAHHLVVDGVSWRIILEDLANLLSQGIDSTDLVKLPAKTLSYQKWASDLKEYAQTIKSNKYNDNNLIENAYVFKTDYDIGDDTIKNCYSITQELSEYETQRLQIDANTAYNTHQGEILLISFILTLSEFWSKSGIGIELESHGRDEITKDIDISRTVGWFTNIYKIIFKVNDNNLSNQIKTLKEQIKHAASRGLELGINRNFNAESSNKYIRYNYLGEFKSNEDNDFFEILEDNIGTDYSDDNEITALIDVNSMILKDKLKITISYSRNKFADGTIEKLMELYLKNIRRIVEHCCSLNTKEYTPSDFDAIDISQEDLNNLFN